MKPQAGSEADTVASELPRDGGLESDPWECSVGAGSGRRVPRDAMPWGRHMAQHACVMRATAMHVLCHVCASHAQRLHGRALHVTELSITSRGQQQVACWQSTQAST